MKRPRGNLRPVNAPKVQEEIKPLPKPAPARRPCSMQLTGVDATPEVVSALRAQIYATTPNSRRILGRDSGPSRLHLLVWGVVIGGLVMYGLYQSYQNTLKQTEQVKTYPLEVK